MDSFLADNAGLLFRGILAVLLWYMGLRGFLWGRATERDGTVITGTDARKVGLLFLLLAAGLTYSCVDDCKAVQQKLLREATGIHRSSEGSRR